MILPRRAVQLCALSLLAACGVTEDEAARAASSAQAIVGGTVVRTDPNVFLLRVVGDTGAGSYCTATLIDAHTLLTAAHCVDPSLLGATSLTVQATNAPTDAEATPANTWRVSAWQRHPDWNSVTLAGDVALALLPTAPGVTPKPWNAESLAAGSGWPLRVLGYGTTGPSGAGAGVKREVALQIRTVSATRISLGDLTSEGICHGDSGGPSFHTFGDGVERVVGVHSYTVGADCVDGADTRVDAYAGFVRQWLGVHEAPSCSQDTRCVPGCTPPDVDCLCAADGVCSAQCPDLSLDPDCPPDCGPNGVCATQACPRPDEDCVAPGQPCTSVGQCVGRKCVTDPQHPIAYCSQPCGAGPCPAGMECDASQVCRFVQRPSAAAGEPCVPDLTWCGPNGVCSGRSADSRVCGLSCNASIDCAKDQACVAGFDSQRLCLDPPRPPVLLPLAAVSEPAAGCTAAPGGLGLALLVALGLGRRHARKRADDPVSDGGAPH